MRTLYIEKTLYTYDELDSNAKKNAKERILDMFHTTYLFAEDCIQDLKNLFGVETNLKVEYSLSCCQGDGLNIYGSIDAKNIIECLEKHNAGDQLKEFENILTEKEKKTILKYAEYCGDIYIPENDRYTYSMANCISLDDWIVELESYKFKKINTKAIEKFESMLKGIFENLNTLYENDGYKYFYEIDEQELKEICLENDYEFYEDGTLF